MSIWQNKIALQLKWIAMVGIEKVNTEWKLKQHVNLKKSSDNARTHKVILKYPMTEHILALSLWHTGKRYLSVQPFQPEAQDNLATS